MIQSKIRRCELRAGGPGPAVEKLPLHCGPEELHEAVVTLEETRPIDPKGPASRRRCPNTQDVYWDPRLEWTTVPGAGRRCHWAHLEGVDDQFGADVVGDGPPDDPPRADVDHGGVVDLPLPGGVFR